MAIVRNPITLISLVIFSAGCGDVSLWPQNYREFQPVGESQVTNPQDGTALPESPGLSPVNGAPISEAPPAENPPAPSTEQPPIIECTELKGFQEFWVTAGGMKIVATSSVAVLWARYNNWLSTQSGDIQLYFSARVVNPSIYSLLTSTADVGKLSVLVLAEPGGKRCSLPKL